MRPPVAPNNKQIDGFSRLTKAERRQWLLENFLPAAQAGVLPAFDAANVGWQGVLDKFSENTVANFPLPFGVAPNFVVNGRTYAVPMVIEESSVVAAASAAAKYWMTRGGFRAEVLASEKLGQLHFRWSGRPERRASLLSGLCTRVSAQTDHLTARMEERGGGVRGLTWKHLPEVAPDCYQLLVRFGTADSMGANFINTILEAYGRALESWAAECPELADDERDLEVIMAILSNHTPNCVVRAWVSCPIEQMNIPGSGVDAADFARRFQYAVEIARQDPYRAVTHNKGIMNGVDAVVLATGNDFRAIEAATHAFAAQDGQYRGLSRCRVVDGHFHFELTLPLAIGTVGGLTRLHPMASVALDLLGQPTAEELMCVMAAAGLAQNFAALRSLVTTGIQRGHMKMHLQNILSSLAATEAERRAAEAFFAGQTVSHFGVRSFLEGLRG
ncbi:hydroxymethylglutaryl-CoA reductase [Neolewinella lacunae]|uniref:Hydroxymethylglutaryl-CoA reductase n=1 Tax=Neolewinella lacunae TaxID=1517758 RepID=A0A923TA57_9BACT|nr:hydroxymethylglutaryl-CoA reductase [Neolewinella lacunae]MBC6995803.1 hydroxymethylglutaryl-CoA reductase [Neolewinella lacunae]MDN3636504.1 hydroxymethylglutaryl-CoA reductase [Neolewinella lacunae]